MDMGSFMQQFVQQLINGISLGSIYALVALGYTMIYGIIKLINFAHGDIYMLGAYFGFIATTMFGFSFIPAILFSMACAALAGIIIERVAYRPMRNAPRIAILITAIGVSFFGSKQPADRYPDQCADFDGRTDLHCTKHQSGQSDACSIF